MLAAVFSAEISSADAVLFMITTSAVRDILEPVRSGRMADASLLSLARRCAVAAGALGILLARYFQSVLSALSFFYSLLTVTLFVPLVAGLFWERPGQPTALVAIGCSLSAAAIVVLYPESWGGRLGPEAAGIGAGALVFAARGIARRRPGPYTG